MINPQNCSGTVRILQKNPKDADPTSTLPRSQSECQWEAPEYAQSTEDPPSNPHDSKSPMSQCNTPQDHLRDPPRPQVGTGDFHALADQCTRHLICTSRLLCAEYKHISNKQDVGLFSHQKICPL